MKRSTNNYGFIYNSDGVFAGISLGHHICAEHSWGYDEIKKKFGIAIKLSKNALGISNRMIKTTPQLYYREERINGVQCATLHTSIEDYKTGGLPSELKNYFEIINNRVKFTIGEKDMMLCVWDFENFGISVVGEKETILLRKLKNAIDDKNVIIVEMNDNIFSKKEKSLGILLISKLSDEYKEEIYKLDKKKNDLEVYTDRIKMSVLVKNSEHNYGDDRWFFICKPEWIAYEDKKELKRLKKIYNTKYDIRYFVNNSKRNSGGENYYTVEQVKDWLGGKKFADL